MAGTGTPSTGSPPVRRVPASIILSPDKNHKLLKDDSPRIEASRRLLSQLRIVSYARI